MVSIEHQVAVVTGAGRGIGRAIAVELGKLGARVVLAARSRTELEETARTIGSSASVIPTDVRKKGELHKLFEQVATAFGPVDLLVNAAGLGIFGPVTDFKDEDFEILIETNLRGIFFASRFVLPSMIERKKGQIINIASIAGKVGSANRAVYCASKWAMVGLTQTLAEEAGRYNITANAIAPGPVRGPRIDSVIRNRAAQMNVAVEEVERQYIEVKSAHDKIRMLERQAEMKTS